MDLLTALAHLRDEDTTSLDIYWLEQNAPDDAYWWCDIIVDKLNTLCASEWTWTVMSQKEYEYEEPNRVLDFDVDWFIVVAEETCSDNLIGATIHTWLRDHGFDFKVNVVTPEGSIEMERMMALSDEATCKQLE